MPLCTNCGSHDVEQTDENEFACLDCGSTFIYDGCEPEEQAVEPEGLELDMQEFEDRLSCIGDD